MTTAMNSESAACGNVFEETFAAELLGTRLASVGEITGMKLENLCQGFISAMPEVHRRKTFKEEVIISFSLSEILVLDTQSEQSLLSYVVVNGFQEVLDRFLPEEVELVFPYSKHCRLLALLVLQRGRRRLIVFRTKVPSMAKDVASRMQTRLWFILNRNVLEKSDNGIQQQTAGGNSVRSTVSNLARERTLGSVQAQTPHPKQPECGVALPRPRENPRRPGNSAAASAGATAPAALHLADSTNFAGSTSSMYPNEYRESVSEETSIWSNSEESDSSGVTVLVDDSFVVVMRSASSQPSGSAPQVTTVFGAVMTGLTELPHGESMSPPPAREATPESMFFTPTRLVSVSEPPTHADDSMRSQRRETSSPLRSWTMLDSSSAAETLTTPDTTQSAQSGEATPPRPPRTWRLSPLELRQSSHAARERLTPPTPPRSSPYQGRELTHHTLAMSSQRHGNISGIGGSSHSDRSPYLSGGASSAGLPGIGHQDRADVGQTWMDISETEEEYCEIVDLTDVLSFTDTGNGSTGREVPTARLIDLDDDQ